MNPKGGWLILLMLLVPICSAETVSLLLGERYNLTVDQSTYTIALVGLTKDTTTFIISGRNVNPGINETKVLDLTGDGKGDVGITLNEIMPNSTANVTFDYNVGSEKLCKPIDEKCVGFNDCCAGKCIVEICSYIPTVQANATAEVNLTAPENITLGGIATVRISGEDGSAVADVTVDVITPRNDRLSFTTNESGEGSFLASDEGVYSYIVYGYISESNATTLSYKPAPPPPPKPLCGDGKCNGDENCSTCSKDCEACPTQTPAPTTKAQDTSWPLWFGLMFVAILLIMRAVLPVFFREQ
jgi:hypothetical protein